jgi:hypothetical protein
VEVRRIVTLSEKIKILKGSGMRSNEDQKNTAGANTSFNRGVPLIVF